MPKDAPKVNYRLPGFFAKFWELQVVMWTTNAGLTDRHTYDSRPQSWPILRRGIVSRFLYACFLVAVANPIDRTSGSKSIVTFTSLETPLLGG